LRSVEELRGIRRLSDGGLEIRALTTHRQAERAPEVHAYCPALAEVFSRVATVRIRNQATVGGNLAHADPAQDPPPMLLALGARVLVTGPDGERTLPLEDFFVNYFQTALTAGEVLTAIHMPPLPPNARATYVKFLPRTEDDYATVSVAAVLCLGPDGVCEAARLGLGSVAAVPMRARRVEDALRQERLTPERVREAAALVREEVDPLDDVRGSARYKREMARVWTERALLRLLDGGSWTGGRNGSTVSQGDRISR
jgi:carbon-monoxide dehydrogenase medium subunit